MSAADIPEMRPDSLAMTRMLVKTMRCDEAVQQRLREDFDHPPCLRTIRRLRIEAALCAMPAVDTDPYKAHEGYYPSDVSRSLDKSNAAFLGLLRNAYPGRFTA